MEEYKRVIWTGILFIAIVGIGFGIYYFFFYGKSEKPLLIEEVKEEPSEVQVEKPEKKAVERVPRLDGLNLDKSDELVRELARELSSHPKAALWLKNEDLIRKFVAVIDNIANGMSPRPHLEFLAPKGKFEVIKKGDSFYINPASYARYNLVAEIFASLDAEECAKLYWDLRPLLQKAYLELGYPAQDFNDTFFKAIVEFLKTPVVDGGILLEKKVMTYMMVNPKLEQLTPPQKHLIRTGARNVRKIQAKLRELTQALGYPENQLPRPVVYTSFKR